MKRSSAAIASMVLMAACSGQQPSTTLQATPSPSAVTSSTAAAPSAPASFVDQEPGSRLAAGTYVLQYASIGGAQAFPTLAITFTVPAGWDRVRVDGLLWNDKGARLGFLVVDNLYIDPCDPDRGLRTPAVGPSVDDLTRALGTLPGWEVTEVAEDTFYGFAGNRLELTGPADLSACANGEARLLHTLGSPGYAPALSNSERRALRILNVAGTRLVIDASSGPETPTQVQTELRAILDSIEIQP